MAKKAKDSRRIESTFQELVGELVDSRLRRLEGVDGLVRLLRTLQRRVDSLERKVTRLGQAKRSGGRGGKKPGRPPLHEGCLVEGCGAEHYALGLCSRHYQQWRRGRRDLQEVVDRAKAGAKGASGKTPAGGSRQKTPAKSAARKAAGKVTAKAKKKTTTRRGGGASRKGAGKKKGSR